jgi:hypothetical protein
MCCDIVNIDLIQRIYCILIALSCRYSESASKVTYSYNVSSLEMCGTGTRNKRKTLPGPEPGPTLESEAI